MERAPSSVTCHERVINVRATVCMPMVTRGPGAVQSSAGPAQLCTCCPVNKKTPSRVALITPFSDEETEAQRRGESKIFEPLSGRAEDTQGQGPEMPGTLAASAIGATGAGVGSDSPGLPHLTLQGWHSPKSRGLCAPGRSRQGSSPQPPLEGEPPLPSCATLVHRCLCAAGLGHCEKAPSHLRGARA